MADCAAILKVQHNHKIPLIQRCQQRATTSIDGVALCGIHYNALYRGDLQVVTTLKRTPNGSLR